MKNNLLIIDQIIYSKKATFSSINIKINNNNNESMMGRTMDLRDFCYRARKSVWRRGNRWPCPCCCWRRRCSTSSAAAAPSDRRAPRRIAASTAGSERSDCSDGATRNATANSCAQFCNPQKKFNLKLLFHALMQWENDEW